MHSVGLAMASTNSFEHHWLIFGVAAVATMLDDRAFQTIVDYTNLVKFSVTKL